MSSCGMGRVCFITVLSWLMGMRVTRMADNRTGEHVCLKVSRFSGISCSRVSRIPGKGKILTQISVFWFNFFAAAVRLIRK